MSYPFIGMEGIGYKKYDAAEIELMLRQGHHIFDDRFQGVDGEGVSCFDGDSGKFKFDYPTVVDDKTVRKVREFDSFVELATFVAFYWHDFL